MHDRNRLGQTILEHWQTYRPKMVEELQQANQLDQAIYEAQERTGDLLYELVSVQNMDYQAAWEMAMSEWAFLRARPVRSHPPRVDADDPPATPSRDFRITTAHRIGEGSLREKALANLEAIRTLKQVEADERDATDAEKPSSRATAGGERWQMSFILIHRGSGKRSPTS